MKGSTCLSAVSLGYLEGIYIQKTNNNDNKKHIQWYCCSLTMTLFMPVMAGLGTGVVEF